MIFELNQKKQYKFGFLDNFVCKSNGNDAIFRRMKQTSREACELTDVSTSGVCRKCEIEIRNQVQKRDLLKITESVIAEDPISTINGKL